MTELQSRDLAWKIFDHLTSGGSEAFFNASEHRVIDSLFKGRKLQPNLLYEHDGQFKDGRNYSLTGVDVRTSHDEAIRLEDCGLVLVVRSNEEKVQIGYFAATILDTNIPRYFDLLIGSVKIPLMGVLAMDFLTFSYERTYYWCNTGGIS